jgi:hypothetical protein
MAIHIHLPSKKKVADRKVKDASPDIQAINIKYNQQIRKVGETYEQKIKAAGATGSMSLIMNPGRGEGSTDPKIQALVKEYRAALKPIYAEWEKEVRAAKSSRDESPAAELARLETRYNAFTKEAPLAEKAKVAARIKELKEQLKASDAGFSKQEYSPREWNRLQGEIKEVEARIKALKAKPTVPPLQVEDQERVLAKLKAEQGKYRTDDSDPSLELAYAVERNPQEVGKRAKKQFKSESAFLEALLKGGMSRSESCVQEALKAYRTADAAPTEALEKQLDEVQARIEKLEDQGQAIPNDLRAERTKLQQQVMAAKLKTEDAGEEYKGYTFVPAGTAYPGQFLAKKGFGSMGPAKSIQELKALIDRRLAHVKQMGGTDDAGGVESLSAEEVMERWGMTFLSRVTRQKEATAPDGSVVRVDGKRFTVVK